MNAHPKCDALDGRWWRTAMFSLLIVVFLTAISSAQTQCDECSMKNSCISCCHELPELWLINTRHLPKCSNLDEAFECISIQYYDRKCGRFVKSSIEQFLSCEATMPTLFYLHGNSLTHSRAISQMWDVYERMRCCPGKKRLVCWSWSSERVFKTQGLRVREMIQKNLRIKYVYAEYQGYYLAKLVERMNLSQRVMLSGHSYGAISTSVALHLLGGGSIRGLALESGAPIERANLRATLISGAFDNDMLYPGHRYGQAFVAAEKIFLTHNFQDNTLRRWPDTSWTGRQAIGLTGINATCLGEYRDKLCQMNTYPENARSHYLGPHLENPRFISALCCLTFGNHQSSPVMLAEDKNKAVDAKQIALTQQTAEPGTADTIAIAQPEGETKDPTELPSTQDDSADEPSGEEVSANNRNNQGYQAVAPRSQYQRSKPTPNRVTTKLNPGRRAG